MRCLALFALLGSGCMFGVRVSALATVDTNGHPGAMIALGGSMGLPNVLFTPSIEGGVERPHPTSGELRIVGAVEYFNRWRHLGLRAGPRVGVDWIGSSLDHVGATLGGSVAVLPTLVSRPLKNRPDCPDARTSLHLGLATDADYSWADHRGHFAFGPSFELYSEGGCD